ncbi:MAG: hypothetical protein R3A51_10100 [Nannocystaceae bacterium]|nr:hypothetical protein [Myxococcales bacterium]
MHFKLPSLKRGETPERRRHRVFATRFTEYHLRDDQCVGVRDRESGKWVREHAALRLRAVDVPERGHDRTWIGRRLQFWGSHADVLTSPVVEIGRPERPVVDFYVSQEVSGEIVC